MKYGGGRMQIAVWTEDDTVHLSVADNGPGVPSEFLDRLFTPFTQADEGDRRGAGGAGDAGDPRAAHRPRPRVTHRRPRPIRG
jgi:signal transduction histidine kinase